MSSDIDTTLDRLSQVTPDSEFKAEVLGPLRDAYRPGRGWAEAFELALRHLLRERRIVIVQGNHPLSVTARRDVLARDWVDREEVEARLRSRSAALERAGWPRQVSIAEKTTNLFIEGDEGRDRLVWEGDRGHLRRAGAELSGDAVERLVREEPERVSPGVLLRPVAEAAALPVIAQVVGPSEIAYLAQNQVLFDFHGVPAPVVVPRAGFRLVEDRVGKVLDKYAVDPDAFHPHPGQAIERMLKEQTPAELRDALRELRASVGRHLQKVESAALEFDRGARSAVGAGKASIFRGIEDLETRLEGRVKEQNDVMRRQLEKAAVNLAPSGTPQERVLNVYPFLVRYGDPLLDAVYDRVVGPLG